jgi:fatty-acid peroxygenase
VQGFPRAPTIDATFALLREGYGFISRRCTLLGSDVFRTRLMLKPALCARGPEAAEIFYVGDRFTRQGAMPAITLRLLQDKGSVQLLDGPAHRHRKAMFVGLLLDDQQVAALMAAVSEGLERALPDWEKRGEIDLIAEMVQVLTVAGGRWAGLPDADRPIPMLARELGGMVANAGNFGPSAWRALLARSRHERYIRSLVRRIRTGDLALAPSAPARIVAEHCDAAGRPMSEAEAAVELINLLRPIVAVAWFIGFAAVALDRHSGWRERLWADDDWLEPFVEEVRRISPFFPFIGGIARADFDWRGETIPKGAWMLLDLYGGNHHPASFAEPFRFEPERRLSWRDQSYSFIPQGAGPVRETHRCPGERVTVEIMKAATAFLACSLTYRLRPVGSLPMTRYPAIPREGLRLENVRRRTFTGERHEIRSG